MSNGGQGQFGDTTLTKVFVGGLAWETPMETLRDHFLKFGDILEAVIISDKLSGRSKGYGFVTFKDPEAAKKACEDPTPIINNRRANCNLAVVGARRSRVESASPTPPLLTQQVSNNNNVGLGMGMGGKVGGVAVVAPPASHHQWYYPAAASPFHHHQHQAVPYYGYSPAAYVAADYNPKVAYNGGAYYPHHMYTGVAAGHAVMGGAPPNTLIPMYHQHPLYHHYQHQQYQLHHHHRAQAMGLPAHMFPVSTTGQITVAGPTALISKPTPLPTPVGMYGYGIGAVAVVAGEGLKSTS